MFFISQHRSHCTDFGLNLQLIADIASEEDLKEVQVELKQYIVTMPRLVFIEFPYSDEYCFRRTRIRRNQGKRSQTHSKALRTILRSSRKISKST